ncbi:serine/threonine-protein kinase [Tautonia plasticadhaerens]|uniref:Serine/threonine-protein kinase PknD n=1 Tax=Tautonia plasticadhaerens TaxID=2527974 RepID=A0A518GUP6_9BACT|nr:serine/threonine-protein kinase [Tautonia plasticadhaerens]QDV32309.1 Serine/threonine-protein kinase PknD [Tautonia plasticadhaerens]
MAAADRDLVFGLLALQNGLIDQDELLAAFRAWTRDRSRPLADHLVVRGDLDADTRSAVEAMVALHLKKEGGNAERSLASIPVGRSTRERLNALEDPDLTATVARLGPVAGSTEAGADVTASYAVGTATADGRRFRVLRPHARGGLGAVFVALDEELHREVALKQIRGVYADDPTSRQRFVLEAEITGGLEHPGIVPVYGLGTYGDGRPYYAMRFVRGDSLKEAIDRFHEGESLEVDPGARPLGLRKLLRRFTDVCNAIDYAHGRGVLHRDLKPGNVIVGKHGETLVVDWGLAKATGRADPGAGERTLVLSSASGSAETLPGSALGTPAYMSPEQAAGDLDRLGPRSDIYSLGATLYCLLTGKPPFEGDDLGAVLRRVRQGDFPPPRALDPTLDPALEAICLKAMAREPGERYASCRALAEDLDRWAADEPVTAWREPPSRRARRWARRNRTAMVAAAVTLVAVVVGLGVVAGVQSRANGQLRLANRETGRALEATRKAQAATRAALEQSEESRTQAEAVGAFLVQAFRSPDPSMDGRQVRVAEILDQAVERLETEFTGSQATRGALLDALGRTYRGLGMLEKAEGLLTRARTVLEGVLGPDHPQTLASRSNLANAYMDAGRTSEAIALHESTLRLFEAYLGPDHPDTLQCRNDLAVDHWYAGQVPKAIALHEETLRRREATLGPDHPDTLQSRQNLAIAYSTGQMSKGIAMFAEVLRLQEEKLGPDHPHTLESRNDLAAAYREAGRLPEAIALDEETLRLREVRLGPDHRETLSSRSNLALDYAAAGRLPEAISLAEEVLRLREATLGPDHPETLIGRLNLADLYRDAGRPEAIGLNEAALKQLTDRHGPDHLHTLICRSNLAASYLQDGRLPEAVAFCEATLGACEATLGPDHFVTLWNRGNLATAYESLGRWSEAEGLLRDALASRRKTETPDSHLVAGDLAQLGRDLLMQSRWSEAEPILREAMGIAEKAPADDWRRYDAMSLLGGSLAGQGRYADAEPLAVAGYEGMMGRELRLTVPERHRLREAAVRLVRLYEAWGKPEKAAEWEVGLGTADLPADVFAQP